jgi:hypothetical protein
MTHTPGPWRVGKTTGPPSRDIYARVPGDVAGAIFPVALEPNNGIRPQDHDDNANLLALAPTAPHDCEIPDCPGMANKRLLEAAEGLLDIIKRAEYTIDGPVGDLLTGDQMAETGAYDWLALAQEALAAATGGGE